MESSPKGVALIKEFEGLVLTRYIDAAGYPTIGWGHKLEAGELYKIITTAVAEQLLASDLHDISTKVNRLIKVPVTQSMFDALVSFGFNLGTNALATSTLLKKLNSRDYAGTKLQFQRWNKAVVNGKFVVLAGLTRRRTAEANLFGSQPYPSKLFLKLW